MKLKESRTQCRQTPFVHRRSQQNSTVYPTEMAQTLKNLKIEPRDIHIYEEVNQAGR